MAPEVTVVPRLGTTAFQASDLGAPGFKGPEH
jgi:hypothetical protein